MALEHFRSIPWCNELLSKPNTKIFTPFSRSGISGLNQDRLFGSTLNDSGAIPYLVSFYTDSGSASKSAAEGDNVLPVTPTSDVLISTSTTLYQLTSGVNGFQGVTHGGMVAVLMDESMGNHMWMNHASHEALSELKDALKRPDLTAEQVNYMTRGLNYEILAPIVTPQIVQVVVHIKEISGRRMDLSINVESSKGKVLATGKATWLGFARKDMKL